MAFSSDIEKNKSEDQLKLSISRLMQIKEKIYEGGGKKRQEKQRAKGKMTVRERISYLVDKGSMFFETGTLAAYEMYEGEGGAPSAGVVTGIGKVKGRHCMIIANDATVKAGAWFPMTAKKNLRAQEIAMENHLPTIYLVDSAGVYLPMQDEVFPDKEDFGRIFRNNARMSSKGIIQIAAIMGSCVAGGAYLPIMSDESLIVEETGSIFLAGPYLVRAAIGEDVDKETLGGATTQSEISGITDFKMKNDQECLDKIQELISHINPEVKTSFNRSDPTEPERDVEEIFQNFPYSRTQPYNVKDVLECIVDKDSLTYYKDGYGKTIVCAYARIDGWSVGVVANNREIVRTKKGEMQFGGVIYSDSADKAARFVMICNQKNIPLIFLQDVTGFMVGSRSEHGGIIKDGAKLVNAVSNSTVPKFTVVTGNSYGAGNYAMCGKAYDPRLILAWPSAQIAVMGGEQAAKVLQQIRISALRKKGEEPDQKKQEEIFKEIRDRYEAQTSPYYAAARLWVDDIIDPTSTRQWISTGIEIARFAPSERFNVGVLQT